MKVTIVPDDNLVVVDGVSATLPTTFPATDANVHAIQWDGAVGFVEHKLGGTTTLSDESVITPYVTAHSTEVARLAAETAAASAPVSQ